MLSPLFQLDAHPPKGPGESGAAVVIDKSEKAEEKRLYKINQFNLLACNRISLNRSLPDYRAHQ